MNRTMTTFAIFLIRETLILRRETRYLRSSALSFFWGAALAVTLCGVGGSGKTQVALEYAYTYAKEYPTTFWVGAKNESRLATSVRGVVESIIDSYSGEFSSEVFDNYDDPDACNIDTLLPTQDVGHILITSRTLKHRLGPRSIEVSAADTNDLKAKESTQAQNKTPILLEDAENVFLGPEKETERPVGHIIDREYHENSGHLIITVDLDIGWAHGADVGAIYDVIPLGEPIQADLGIKAQITESLGNKGLQSRATIRYPLVWGTHTSASGYPHAFNTLERVKSGSGVVPQKWGLTPVVSVKISSLRQRWI
ncbi:hypothetical protein TWF217_001022 [Orbilia oligospora]|nr:hypothetical protein TWF217_001022 [Orbilia oligospora]